MKERLKFIIAYREQEETISALCDEFEISRKTAYKWISRYEESGIQGIYDRSSRPLSHPRATAPEICERILTVRRKHRRWGPKKIRTILQREPEFQIPGGIALPALSTIGKIIQQNGLSKPRRRIRRSSPYREPLREYQYPNSVWCADFKGSFLVKSGDRCHPITITDGYSRKLLCCTGLLSTTTKHVKKAFISAFKEFGLPDAIRTDNGPPFSTLAAGGLSQLAVWWIRLGIRPERIQPGRPDQNGRHERMHRTLKEETARPPQANMRAQQLAFDQFMFDYNSVRPHEALGQNTPDSVYERSLVSYPEGQLSEIEYPSHFKTAIAYPNGVISFSGVQWMVSASVGEQILGLENYDNDRWRVYFGPIELGTIDLREFTRRGSRNFGAIQLASEK